MIPEFVNESGLIGLLSVMGVVAAMCVAAGITHFAFSIAIRLSQRSGPNTLDTRILSASRGPVVLFLVILGVFSAYFLMTKLTHPAFDFFNGHGEWVVRIWLVIVIAEAGYLGSHIIQALLQWYLENISQRTASDLDDRLLPQVRRVTPIVIYALGALMALDVVGIAITPLIAGLGIGGIAVALALQPTLSNLFSGTFMISEGELNEGDFIELDGGPSGFVVDVSWRSTKIRDRFNNLIMIPNSKIMDSIMTNYYSQSKVMTVMVACGVSYDSDLEHVEKVALEVAKGVRDDLDSAIKDYEPSLLFTNFGDSNIDFLVIIQGEDRLGTFYVKHELIKRLHTRFNREGIEINYPVRKLVVPPSDGIDGMIYDAEQSSDGLESVQPTENSGE